MSLTLILIRHAKSDWDDPTLDDHDRPLNERGRRDAPRIGAWLRAKGHVPVAAMISTAVRAAETWARLGFDTVQASYHHRLYHAPAPVMLGTLATARSDAPVVAMVGHNPGIAECAERLLAHSPDHARFSDYPTCATLVARFDAANWSDIHWGTGTVLDFATPHDLR
ncbi:SixA phosphatase family protein [Rhodophyticola porphyridii]|uniref:Histidine phosphatase family protein n=1 Tax=Rhodophyticola porphyridii TaxID=1852017 RepID=A0A3L9XYI4_9RHOB|nr:histidine phosphatase family protein [Rhodophyticola porphyridii]RMA41292.1 histidine phosphatase family protein [Rhodophyticola porphyridii]